jgi:hypothetical protein
MGTLHFINKKYASIQKVVADGMREFKDCTRDCQVRVRCHLNISHFRGPFTGRLCVISGPVISDCRVRRPFPGRLGAPHVSTKVTR